MMAFNIKPKCLRFMMSIISLALLSILKLRFLSSKPITGPLHNKYKQTRTLLHKGGNTVA